VARERLHELLGYPNAEFYEQINVIPYYPAYLLETLQKPNFPVDLRYYLYNHDIDLVLLDISLTKPGLRPEAEAIKKHGFNFIDTIQRQLVLLGRPSVPVIVFTAYDEQMPFVVESVHRGAKWFCSKDSAKADWVGNLHEILSKIYSPWFRRQEYLQKYLSECHGRTSDLLQRILNGQNDISKPDYSTVTTETIVPCSEFDLHDPSLHMVDDNADTVNKIVSACQMDNGDTCDLNKFWEYHYIFRKLFAGYDKINILKQVESGLSGTDVFFVQPYKDETEYSVQIVKIGAREVIEQEATNFEERINGLLDSFVGRIKGPPVRADVYAGLLYVSIGIKDDYINGHRPISLSELIKLALDGKQFHEQIVQWEQVQEFIHNLFSTALSCFYRQGVGKSRMQFCSLISAYLEYLPSVLSGSLVALRRGPTLNNWEIFDDREGINLVAEEGVDAFKTTNLTDALQYNRQFNQRGEGQHEKKYCYLENYEIYEIDRIGKKIRLTNRCRDLPTKSLPGHFSWDLSEKERYLNNLDRKTDVRVDVRLTINQAQKLFADPRIGRGKRLSILIGDVSLPWNDQTIRFLDNPQQNQSLFSPCRKFLEKPVDGPALLEASENGTVYLLFELLRGLGESGVLATQRELTFSHIHGDLNLENILVTRTGNSLLGWFIDFAKAKRGHSVFDFVKLETEIKTHLIASYLSQFVHKLALFGIGPEAAVQACLQWFVKFEQTGQTSCDLADFLTSEKILNRDVFCDEVQKLDRLAKLIMQIRKLAAEYELATEYNWGLLFYSVCVLKFKNLDKIPSAPLPKTLAYIAGCCAYKKLEESDPYLMPSSAFQQVFLPALQVKRKGQFLSDAEVRKMLKTLHDDPGNSGLMAAWLDALRFSHLPTVADT
jgi:hypothetical protein